ncbi:hypothetical protein H4S14_003658 [Agrobacterium vitis]|nr:hypothetical protein [Agrobacterium vitis]MBE1439890.1 hypothetical protein [Agrobacterium vitis]
MQFYFPTEPGEQLAFLGAAITAAFGFVMMFAPAMTMRFFGLCLREGRYDGLALFRFTGGMMLGLGLGALLLAQPMVYLAVGATLGIALFGLVLSALQDHGATMRMVIVMIVVAMLVMLPLVYVFALV